MESNLCEIDRKSLEATLVLEIVSLRLCTLVTKQGALPKMRGRNIRKKTHNLTQNCARNVPINNQVRVFHSVFRKKKFLSSSGELFLLL